MAENWPQEQLDVYNDLLEDGVVFTFTRSTPTGFDPETGAYSGGETEEYSAPGIVKRLSGRTESEIIFGAGTVIEQNDILLLLGAKNYSPQLFDETTIDGIDYRVGGVSFARPGVLPLLIYLLLKRR
jgi:hypothetical protein